MSTEIRPTRVEEFIKQMLPWAHGHQIKAITKFVLAISEQEAYSYRASGVARFAWNWALDEYKRRKAAGQEIDWNEIKIEFRSRINTEFPFVREVTKCAAEAAIADLRQAINTYYKTKGANPKLKAQFPGRRKRSKKIGGFGLNNDKFSVSGNTVYVPKLGEVNMAEALRFDGRIL